MKTVILDEGASGTRKKLRERMIKGHIIMRFGTEYKVFLEMIAIGKMKACFLFCRFNVVAVYILVSTVRY
jgi:hypothetical protein